MELLKSERSRCRYHLKEGKAVVVIINEEAIAEEDGGCRLDSRRGPNRRSSLSPIRLGCKEPPKQSSSTPTLLVEQYQS